MVKEEEEGRRRSKTGVKEGGKREEKEGKEGRRKGK